MPYKREDCTTTKCRQMLYFHLFRKSFAHCYVCLAIDIWAFAFMLHAGFSVKTASMREYFTAIEWCENVAISNKIRFFYTRKNLNEFTRKDSQLTIHTKYCKNVSDRPDKIELRVFWGDKFRLNNWQMPDSSQNFLIIQ